MEFSMLNFQFSKILSVVLLVMVFLFSASSALAICEGPIVPCGGADNPCQFCHLFVLIERIINFIFTCLVPIAASLMLIVGGLYLLIAGPSPEKVNQAKGIITAAVIGIVIIFVAWIFLNTFLDYMGIKEWTRLGTWWDFTTKCSIK